MNHKSNFPAQRNQDKSVSSVRNFNVGNINCQYQNRSGIEYERENSNDQTIQIIDKGCQLIGKILVRTIKVKIGNKLITIRDQYILQNLSNPIFENQQIIEEYVVESQNTNQAKEDKSQQIVYQQIDSNSNEEIQKISKNQVKNNSCRNVNKNIFKSFYKYCIQRGSDQQKQFAQALILKNNFTHKAFQAILSNKKVTNLFQHFLSNQFQNWLIMSKVMHKQPHRQKCNQFLSMVRKINKNDYKIGE